MHLPAWSKVLYKPYCKKCWFDIWEPKPIQQYKDTSGYDSEFGIVIFSVE